MLAGRSNKLGRVLMICAVMCKMFVQAWVGGCRVSKGVLSYVERVLEAGAMKTSGVGSGLCLLHGTSTSPADVPHPLRLAQRHSRSVRG